MMMKMQKNRNAWEKIAYVNILETPPQKSPKSGFQGRALLIKRSQAPPAPL